MTESGDYRVRKAPLGVDDQVTIYARLTEKGTVKCRRIIHHDSKRRRRGRPSLGRATGVGCEDDGPREPDGPGPCHARAYHRGDMSPRRQFAVSSGVASPPRGGGRQKALRNCKGTPPHFSLFALPTILRCIVMRGVSAPFPPHCPPTHLKPTRLEPARHHAPL